MIPGPRVAEARPPMAAGTAPAHSYDRLVAAEDLRRRRLVAGAVAAVVVHALLFAGTPRTSPLAQLEARRFGYFGPTQFVPEIEIRRQQDLAEAARAGTPGLVAVSLPQPSGAADVSAASPKAPREKTTERKRLTGGEASRLDLLRASVPVVQSEDLVIEVLVKPEYPYQARVEGLEAIVELEAFVGLDGRVREVRILRNTGAAMFAESARDAVRECRFRPYQQNGLPTPVFARFRFNFKLM